METLKKPIFRFFYPEMLWIVVAFVSTLLPYEKTHTEYSPATTEIPVLNDKNDLKFIIKASKGNLLEIETGKLALSNSSSPEVKKIGNIMIEDHSKMNRELTVIANEKQIVLASTLEKREIKKYNNMAQKKGADFDKHYLVDMIEDHKKNIACFEKKAKDGKDPEIKNWATNKIPVLKHHLHLADEALNSFLKK